jgi:hypothetical protein
MPKEKIGTVNDDFNFEHWILFLLFFAAAEATSRDVRSPLVTST